MKFNNCRSSPKTIRDILSTALKQTSEGTDLRLKSGVAEKSASEPTKASNPDAAVEVHGWVRTVRMQKKVAFVELADGSTSDGIQVVAAPELAQGLETGASARIVGKLVQSPGKNQTVELQASGVHIFGHSNPDTYPLHKGRLPLDHLREHPHLRSRTKAFGAMWRVRNAATMAFRNYFQANEYLEVQPPILTSHDCEGGGEVFRVFNNEAFEEYHTKQSHHRPQSLDNTTKPPDFFGSPAYLTVSSQLHLEALASALGRVYTLNPAFRAEKSASTRHLAEFWMLEAEASFMETTTELMDLIESCLRQVTQSILKSCPEDLEILSRISERATKQQQQPHATISSWIDQDFVRCTYTESIKILQSSTRTWEFPVKWGLPLQSEHERYLAESHFERRPVFVTHYPSAFKPFYMREAPHSSKHGSTVECLDLLVTGVGELVGGSLREERLDVLEGKMRHAGLSLKDYSWYLDLRRFGSTPHGGFGLGFERYLQWVTGMGSVRDVIPSPRWVGHCRH